MKLDSLLDGLDVVVEDACPACIASINAYHRDHMITNFYLEHIQPGWLPEHSGLMCL